MTPKLHTSHFSLYGRPENISGAAYPIVPNCVFARNKRGFVISDVAKPKSEILISLSSSFVANSIFSGFKSEINIINICENHQNTKKIISKTYLDEQFLSNVNKQLL